MNNLTIELCFGITELEKIFYCIDVIKKKYPDAKINVKVSNL